jgi:hypothetical protein
MRKFGRKGMCVAHQGEPLTGNGSAGLPLGLLANPPDLPPNLMAGAAIKGYNGRRIAHACTLKTIHDLVTMIIFAGIAWLFLQRSTADQPRDHMYQYLPPCVGCAIANFAGNHGQDILAWLIILGVVSYVLYVLKPFNQTP